MMIEFCWPTTTGEMLAFGVAVMTIFFGLLLFFMPRFSFRILHLQTIEERPDAIAESRGTMAGFYLGCGLGCIMLAQPLIYLVLGMSWAFTALGRLAAIVFDRAGTPFNLVSVVIEALLAALPLAYVFGYI
ncbi:MAG: DUF4345 domain-containing protein [Hyphomicrobiales bacterium]|nr:DUF4345 domain-containing protein [Hyphomicrobiales bacterium]MCP5001174.1 DUF4345 domain-containing protein [Hyphomicrobiales bacterium]